MATPPAAALAPVTVPDRRCVDMYPDTEPLRRLCHYLPGCWVCKWEICCPPAGGGWRVAGGGWWVAGTDFRAWLATCWRCAALPREAGRRAHERTAVRRVHATSRSRVLSDVSGGASDHGQEVIEVEGLAEHRHREVGWDGGESADELPFAR
jgi:hypothetical protein